MANNTLAYATSKNLTMTIVNASSFLDNIQTKKVRVGDIDIAYKVFGKGEPLLLIPGFSATMVSMFLLIVSRIFIVMRISSLI